EPSTTSSLVFCLETTRWRADRPVPLPMQNGAVTESGRLRDRTSVGPAGPAPPFAFLYFLDAAAYNRCHHGHHHCSRIAAVGRAAPFRRARQEAMAGHSQFKNIMHRKGRQDAAKSKLFSKLAREITVAAKLGLPDPAMNARLRAA